MGISSRKIAGWQIYDTESSELAAELMRDICEREHIAPIKWRCTRTTVAR